MKTTLKLLSVLLLFISSACMFDGVKGNGNVRIEDRSISDNFEEIHVSRGIILDLTSSASTSLTVEADENLQELIKTKVEDGVLKIYAEKNIWSASAKTVHLATNHVVSIVATSGANVNARDVIKTDDFKLVATSGANIDLALNVTNFDCNTTSGTNITLHGTAVHSAIRATSGSNVKAEDFRADSGNMVVTSGANVVVFVENNLEATATSGGNIKYAGSPKEVKKNSSSGGSIRAR